jgi:acyl-lipid omega-6 desaturase (Delta-12 desaturase)
MGDYAPKLPSADSPSPAQIRAALPEGCRSRSTLKGIAIAATTFAAWVILSVCLARTPYWWAKLPLGLAVGFTAGSCFVIGHDACHGALTAYVWLNKIIGRIVFFPSLHPYTSWEYTHNGLHHGWLNIRGRDVVYTPFTEKEYHALPRWRQTAEQCFRSPFGLGAFYFFTVWLKHEFFPRGEHMPPGRRRKIFEWDRGLVAVFFTAWCLGLAVLARHWSTGVASTLFYGIPVSLAMFHFMMGIVTFMHHNQSYNRKSWMACGWIKAAYLR